MQHPYTIGQKYLIRTVTHYYTGRLEGVFTQELLLSDAAWVADTGRYTNALTTGNMEEIEPIPSGRQVIIGRGAIIDCVEWAFGLPREIK